MEEWVEKQLAKLLPVGYFHIVFTLPHELNPIILQNQEFLYDILIDSLYKKDWVVFSKKTFKSPFHVVKYLGRYTHRVAISDSRILNFNGIHVTFEYKDYKDKCKKKLMKLSGTEFIRRFLLHVLPSDFTKIRHYGVLSNRNISKKLIRCMVLLKRKSYIPKIERPVSLCPICGCPLIYKVEKVLVSS